MFTFIQSQLSIANFVGCRDCSALTFGISGDLVVSVIFQRDICKMPDLWFTLQYSPSRNLPILQFNLCYERLSDLFGSGTISSRKCWLSEDLQIFLHRFSIKILGRFSRRLIASHDSEKVFLLWVIFLLSSPPRGSSRHNNGIIRQVGSGFKKCFKNIIVFTFTGIFYLGYRNYVRIKPEAKKVVQMWRCTTVTALI